MTSIIKLTPLSGGSAPGLDPAGIPHCYMLEMDAFTFLLDCGFDAKFESAYVQNDLRKIIHKVDAVLLSYPDTAHLGALPYAVGKLGLNCPIYATVPVYKMGQMFMYDAYLARKNVEEFDLFTLDEVDKAFEMMTQLKYNQTMPLKGKGMGISIVPIAAGHMIGGAIWKIMKDGEEDIIYAVDFNHKKEQHLNGWDYKKIQLPALLITDAYSISQKTIQRRQRDENLMTNILQTLRNDGNVLICVDTAGRVLELAHMIDHVWQIQDSGLLAYSLALVNNVGYNVIEFAKSQIEWMSEKLMKSFEGQRNNPFQFKHLKLCHNMNEVNKVPSPKVVLASMPDMESGFSRELFQNWCGSGRNTVIITSRTGTGTLAHRLVKGKERKFDLEVKKRVKLTGAELEKYRQEQEMKKKMTLQETSMLVDDESSSEEESDLMQIDSDTRFHSGLMGIKKKKSAPRHDIIMRSENSESKPQTGFFKSLKTKYPMFPFHEEKIRWDDYGEIIRIDEWMEVTSDAKAHSNQNGSTNNLHNKEEDASNEDVTEVPTKCVVTTQTFEVKCKILFIDFEGRSDGDSITKVINTLKPRRSIIVRGREESCQKLAEHCQQLFNRDNPNLSDQTAAFVARNGETIDATTESFIYQVRLPETLTSTLNFSKGKEGLFSWVDGRLTYEEDEIADTIKNPALTNESGEVSKTRIATLLPIDIEQTPDRQNVFINELKLHDFKLVLIRNGIVNEFSGGVLYCGANNEVALKRHDSGRVTIEGTVCDEYYRVRKLLYEQYAIV